MRISKQIPCAPETSFHSLRLSCEKFSIRPMVSTMLDAILYSVGLVRYTLFSPSVLHSSRRVLMCKVARASRVDILLLVGSPRGPIRSVGRAFLDSLQHPFPLVLKLFPTASTTCLTPVSEHVNNSGLRMRSRVITMREFNTGLMTSKTI